MADKKQVIKEKIEHSGLVDFKALYSFTHSWLTDENFDVFETDYKESVTGNSRNIHFKWSGTRGMSDYLKHEVSLEFKISDLVEVEVEIDKKKKKMNKGKIWLEMKGTLVKDPESKWDSTPFYRFIRGVYDKYIIPNILEGQENKIIGDVIKLKEQIKAFLEITGRR
jgi:hypothetical protein